VVALGVTEAPFAVPADAGVVTTSRAGLVEAARRFVDDPRAASDAGAAARRHALERYGLKRFLADWDELLADVGS